jgi:hypothetical protein
VHSRADPGAPTRSLDELTRGGTRLERGGRSD